MYNNQQISLSLSLSMGIILPTWILVLVFMIGHGCSDIAEDKKECQKQLIGLSPCLTYVSGELKSPSAICCTEIKKEYTSTERCLCVLVKDRNDPGLGLTINSTLTLSLPYICHAPGANISHCPALLHLAPGSPDAQVFEDFARSLGAGNDVGTGDSTTPKSSSISVKRRWIGRNVSLLSLVVISVLI